MNMKTVKRSFILLFCLCLLLGACAAHAESFRARGFSHVLQQEDMTPDTLVKGVEMLYHDRGALYEAMATEPTANGIDSVLEQIYKYAKN